MAVVQVGPVRFGEALALIAGPCVIEERDATLRLAEGLAELCGRVGVGLVFKASFDKANRTALDSYRGPGLDAGLRILDEVRAAGLPVTTDVHEPWQAAPVAEVCDLLQVPAFLCRQTDLLAACAATGRPVNVKKGPFLAPDDAIHVVDKLRRSGAAGVLLTERGTSFGHRDLVVDFRGLPTLAGTGAPVVFDCTHAAQRPGALGGRSGGDREAAFVLGKAAVAAGVDALFAEVHADPPRALSDAATQLPFERVEGWLRTVRRIREALGSG